MITGIKDFLEFMKESSGEHSVAALLLREGKGYRSQPLTPRERQVVMDAACRTGSEFAMRECFYNAQMLVVADTTKQLKYVEGYGTKLIPVLHGWATINGKVVDLTWRHGREEGGFLETRIWGEFPWEYWGLEFPTEYVKEVLFGEHTARSLITDAAEGWPLPSKAVAPRGAATG